MAETRSKATAKSVPKPAAGASATEPSQEDRKARLAGRKAIKNVRRAQFLGKMPKGGLAIEIGVWRGEFSRKILDTLQPERLCLIDPWKNFAEHDDKAFSGRAEDETMDAIHAGVCRLYAAEIRAKQVVVMREMSADALTTFGDGTINFAYVDGDHSYDGVRTDLAALFPKMMVGGVMAFDDYHRRGWWGDGVLRAIHEFIGRHPSEVRIMTVIGAQIAIEKIAPQA